MGGREREDVGAVLDGARSLEGAGKRDGDGGEGKSAARTRTSLGYECAMEEAEGNGRAVKSALDNSSRRGGGI